MSRNTESRGGARPRSSPATTFPPRVESPRRILVVEPDRSVASMLGGLLERDGYECFALSDAEELLRVCAELEPDLLLLAVDLGAVSGLEYCGDMRVANPVGHLPIILVGRDPSEHATVAALLAGADDYVAGLERLDELRARVRVQLRSKRLFDTLKRVRGERDLLRRDVHLDPLTGLPNRRALMSSLAERCESATRFAVLFLDVDRFKVINDTFGHDVGDRVLVCVADTLNAGLRPGDLMSRYGGEEFVALLAKAGPESARLVAERLRASVEELPAFPRGPERVTISVGATVFEPNVHGEAPRELLRRADAALYVAKSAGRNRVVIHMRDALVPARVLPTVSTSPAATSRGARSHGRFE